ncbi:MAG: thymidylate kinase [Candidatus Sulfotelmatobacter sp.]
MRASEMRRNNPVTVVSFSGIDGAGKSTQITELQSWLEKSGFRTALLTFWDDIVVFSRFREFASLKAFKGDRGVGSPEKPLQRRDKNVTSWPITLARLGLYLADALHLALKVRQAKRSDVDVVIFDRYIYDELANLPLSQKFAIAFTRFALKLVSKPDIAYVIDADPSGAYARKPEYPLEFVRRNRYAYLALARISGAMTVVAPDSIEAMKQKIRSEMVQILAHSQRAGLHHHSAVLSPTQTNISPGELIEH